MCDTSSFVPHISSVSVAAVYTDYSFFTCFHKLQSYLVYGSCLCEMNGHISQRSKYFSFGYRWEHHHGLSTWLRQASLDYSRQCPTGITQQRSTLSHLRSGPGEETWYNNSSLVCLSLWLVLNLVAIFIFMLQYVFNFMRCYSPGNCRLQIIFISDYLECIGNLIETAPSAAWCVVHRLPIVQCLVRKRHSAF